MTHLKKQLSTESINPRLEKKDNSTAQSYYQRARLAVQQGKLPQAIPYYQQTLKHNPQHLIAHQELGNVFLKLEQWQNAITCYHQALEIEPKLPQAHHNMGEAYTRLQQLQEASEEYRKAIELQPQFFWSHNNLGDVLLKLGQWSEACEEYRKAIRLNPDFHWSYYNLGEAFTQLKQWDGAAAAYHKALKLQPDLPLIHQKLGVALSHKAKRVSQEVIDFYQDLINKYPDDLENYYKLLELLPNEYSINSNLVKALLRRKEFDQAVIFTKVLVTNNPDIPDAHIDLASVLEKIGRVEEAAVSYQNAIKLSPKQWKYYVALGELLEKHRHVDRAISAYQNAIQIKPNLAEVKDKIANLLKIKQQGEKQNTEKTIKKLICKAEQYIFEDKLDLAIKEYRKAISFSPDLSFIHSKLGDLLEKQGKPEAAISCYQKVIEQRSDFSNLYSALGSLLRTKGGLAQETNLYEILLELNPDLTQIRDKFQATSTLLEAEKQRKASKVSGLPRDFILPPILGEKNDYSFIEDRVKHFNSEGKKYTLPVSIVILGIHCQKSLANLLSAITVQTYPRELIEVVIVYNENIKDLNKLLNHYIDKIKITQVSVKDDLFKPHLLNNLGIKAASHPYIITLDYDILPHPNLVESFMQYFHVSDNIVLIGNRKFINTGNIESREILKNPKLISELPEVEDSQINWQREKDRKFLKSQLELYKKSDNLKKDTYPFRCFISCNAAYPKKLLEKMGGFDQGFTHLGLQDKEFSYRAYNEGCYFIPVLDALAFHQDPSLGREGIDKMAKHKENEKRFSQKCPVSWYRKYDSDSSYQIPKVSVYIPSYNNGRFIKEAIDSVLNQTMTDVEVCICDDGSTDNTLEVLEKNYKDHPKVRWVAQANGGIGKASNTAVRMCRGMYIGQLDSDDLLKPQAVETLVNYLDKSGFGCVYSSCERIDTEGNYMKDEYSWPVFSREKMITTSIVHHFRMFRRRDWLRTDGFNEELVNAVDYDMFLKLSEVCSFYHINENLYFRRIHGKNTSVVNEKKQSDNTLVVITSALERMGISDEWEVYSPDPEQPRKVAFRRKQEQTNVFFYPDYRKSNTYQNLIYSGVPTGHSLHSGNLNKALQALKYGGGKVIFHLHWTNFILREAQSTRDAEHLKNQFLKKLFDFLYEGGRLIWTIHNVMPHDCPYPKQETEIRNTLLAAATKIHIHSKKSIPEIQQCLNLPLDKVQILPHGHYVGLHPNEINQQTARQSFDLPQDETVFLFLGQIRFYKGIDRLLKAFIELSQNFPKTRLLIAGKPVEPISKEDKIPEHLRSKITFVERYIPGEELQYFFNAADAVVLPYNKVLTSGSMLHALSFGRPVIAPRVGMIEETLEDGFNGFMYDMESLDSLISALSNLSMLSREKLRILFENSLKSIKHLTWDNAATELFSDVF
jgi:tetratricopeptide (TPR) repeat protein